MGLLDFGANVVMRLKADTSDAKAKLKELSAEERKLAEASLKASEAQNKALERKAKAWQFAAQAVGAVTAAYAVGKSGLDAYAKTSEHAAAKVKQFNESGTKAMDSLMSSIGKAVVGLEPLISGVSKLVTKLSEVGVAGPAAIGALALAVTGNPVIAGIVGGGAWALSGDYGFGDMLTPDGRWSIAAGMGKTYRSKISKATGNWGSQYGVDDLSKDLGRLPGLIGDGIVFGLGKAGITAWSPFEAKSSGAGRPARVGDYLGRRSMDFGDAGSGSTTVGLAAQYGDAFGLDTTGYANAAMTNRWKAELDYYNQRGADSKSALEQTFGPLAQFDAYATAFQTLSGAVGSAMSAWIDGSMSAGKAFKAFVAEAVKGLAVQMSIEALKNGAYAVGSLIPGTPFFNPAAAAGYAKTAALFAAGAVAAGAAAKGLGGSGGAPATGGGYSGSAPSTVGPTAGSERSTERIVVVGDSFAEDSPRNQQRKAQRMVRRALGSGYSRPS